MPPMLIVAGVVSIVGLGFGVWMLLDGLDRWVP